MIVVRHGGHRCHELLHCCNFILTHLIPKIRTLPQEHSQGCFLCINILFVYTAAALSAFWSVFSADSGDADHLEPNFVSPRLYFENIVISFWWMIEWYQCVQHIWSLFHPC